MTTYYRIWSEWDMGHEDLLFTSEEAAKKWIDGVNRDNGVYDDGDSLEDIWDDLQGVTLQKVVA